MLTTAERRPERLVALLGYSGLVPFAGLATAVWIDPARATLWYGALTGYGAVILSFVGALHWGFAMTLDDLSAGERDRRFVWSVVPSLLAWAALLVPPVAAALVLIAAFVTHVVEDHRLGRAGRLPPWYLPLRLRLTLIASACLAAAAVGLYR